MVYRHVQLKGRETEEVAYNISSLDLLYARSAKHVRGHPAPISRASRQVVVLRVVAGSGFCVWPKGGPIVPACLFRPLASQFRGG